MSKRKEQKSIPSKVPVQAIDPEIVTENWPLTASSEPVPTTTVPTTTVPTATVPTTTVATATVPPGTVADPDVHSSRRSDESRPFQPRQFLFGLVLAAGGMGVMLFVAAGALHDAGAGGAVSLPATGLCMILGLMLLGGGFGQMAVSSPRFDDTEFQRLLAGSPAEPDGSDDVEYVA